MLIRPMPKTVTVGRSFTWSVSVVTTLKTLVWIRAWCAFITSSVLWELTMAAAKNRRRRFAARLLWLAMATISKFGETASRRGRIAISMIVSKEFTD